MTQPKKPKPADIKASYGFVGRLADGIPELKKILDKAVKGQWTQDRFLMTVADTNWYRSNSAAMREWITLEGVDPAEAAARLESSIQRTGALSDTLGLGLTLQQRTEAALEGMLKGMDDATFGRYLSKQYFDPRGISLTDTRGQVAESQMGIQELRAQYGLMDEDDSWLRGRLGDIMLRGGTVESARRNAIDYAKARYSQFADRLEGGETLADIARPARDSVSRLLEQDVGLDDQVMQRWLQARGEDGQPVDQPIWKLEQEARKDERWDRTVNARQAAADVVSRIGKDFGFLG